MSNLPHVTAAQGFKAKADAYAKARPSYPMESIDFLQKLTKKTPSQTEMLDLGAGTGIMTRLLFEGGYTSLTAVEPVDAMRAKIGLPDNVSCLSGTSWSIPVKSQSQDVVMLAQCFHWFDDMKSLKEIHRVLKPGGLMVLIWNMESKRSPWVAQLRDLYEAYDGSAPQYRLGYWKHVFNEATDLYTPLQHETFQHDTLAKKSDVWTRITSKSYIAILDNHTQDILHEKVQRVIDEYQLEDEFIYPLDTDMYYCYKK
ncbi:hypothetical protein INT47_002598 [Mucor saturninus]|uniref:Methyltransferase type 11 domain-containing protein n=1 Tax=Mucor saturninus TaxID=64648 RepID=A0A8H7R5K9_9FUNG|nr:hypothetical protein INT47_002598 [Mucor saturninus]